MDGAGAEADKPLLHPLVTFVAIAFAPLADKSIAPIIGLPSNRQREFESCARQRCRQLCVQPQ
jgi:hypothetical protein